MKGKPHWWKWGLIVIGLVLLLVIGLFTTAWLALRSPGVQQKILSSLREPLQKAGIQLEVESLALDVFAGLNLQNLHVKIDRPPQIQADLRLSLVRLGYSFWGLLRNRMEISEVLIEGLRGDVRLVLPETVKEEESSQGLGPLIDLIRHPPMELDGPSLIIRDNQLKLQLNQGSRRVAVDLQKADINAALSLHPGNLELSAKIAMELGLELEQSDLHLNTHVALAPDLTLLAKAPDKEFNWDFRLNELDLLLTDTRLQKSGPDASTMQVAFEKLSFTPEISAQRQGPITDNPQVNDILWPLSSEGEWTLALDKLQFQQQKAAHKLTFASSITNENNWKIKLRSLTPGRDQDWDLTKVFKIADIQVTQDGKSIAMTKAFSGKVQSQAEQGAGKASIELHIQPLTSDLLKAPVRFDQQLDLGFNLASASGSLTGKGELNGQNILQLSGESSDQAGTWQSKLQMKLEPHPSLAPLHAALQSLDQIGWPSLDLQLTQQIQHSRPLSEINKDNWQELTITNSIVADIRQQKPSAQTLVRFEKAQIRSELALPAREVGADASPITVNLTLDANKVQHKALRKAIEVHQDLELKASVGERINGQLSGKTKIDSYELLGLTLDWQDKKGELLSESSLTIQADPSLQKISEAAKGLTDLGGVNISSQHKLMLVHGANRLQDLKGLDLNKIKADLQLTQTIAQTPVGKSQRTISWQVPLRLDSRIKVEQGRGELLTRLMEPKITMQGQAAVHQLQVMVKGKVHNLQKPDTGEVKMMVDADSIELLREVPHQEHIRKLLQRFKMVFHGTLENQDQLTIKTLFVGLHDTLLQFKGQGQFRLNSQGHFDGQLDSQFGTIGDSPIAGTGRLQMPIKIVLFDKTRWSVDAEPRFQKFSAQYADMAIKNVNGGIHIHEELQVEQGRIGFLYLDTQNPFARVDYDSLEPYVGDRPQLSVDQLQYKHIVIGPLVENFEIRQNLILLNDLKMDLLRGSALGRFYLDLHPDRLQLGFLGRFSGIQAELLKEPARRIPVKDWAPLSGRMAVNFDIRKRLATGRLDLTEIGQRQLMSLLDVLDPEYKDEQMIMARRGLRVAYPKGVAINMEQGLMDMNINLGGVISKELFIRSIPLTGLINAKAGETLQQIEKLLQSGGS